VLAVLVDVGAPLSDDATVLAVQWKPGRPSLPR